MFHIYEVLGLLPQNPVVKKKIIINLNINFFSKFKFIYYLLFLKNEDYK